METTTQVPEHEVDKYAAKLVHELCRQPHSAPATVLTLTGDLGAGKTTLVQAIARQLGVTDVVTSPTFVVMKSYETTNALFTQLVHIDAYRIEDEAELGPLNFNHVLATPDTLVCIEWPERIAPALPQAVHTLSLESRSDTSRTITYHGY